MKQMTLAPLRTLTASQLRDIRRELHREHDRLNHEDPRRDVFAEALRRVEDGTYGSCVYCGNGIPYDRLAVVPETSHCVTCPPHA